MEELIKKVADPQTLVAIISAIAAFLSALYARHSKEIAKRALSIAEHELALKKDSLSFYLVDAFQYTRSTKKILAFHTTIRNQSLSNNSIELIEAIVTYVRKDDSIGTMIIPHDAALGQNLTGVDFSCLKLPHPVPPKSAISFWSLFALPNNLFSEVRVDKYTLRVTDISGKVEAVDSYIVKESHHV